ncbi:hypothetical protein [Aeribacillus sp. FSL M8-0254]
MLKFFLAPQGYFVLLFNGLSGNFDALYFKLFGNFEPFSVLQLKKVMI